MKVQIDPAYGDPGAAPHGGAVAMVAGTPQAAQRAVAVMCTVAGNITLVLADGSTITVPVAVGLTILPFSATEISAATATATYANLK